MLQEIVVFRCLSFSVDNTTIYIIRLSCSPYTVDPFFCEDFRLTGFRISFAVALVYVVTSILSSFTSETACSTFLDVQEK
jgi:hypothetical protein